MLPRISSTSSSGYMIPLPCSRPTNSFPTGSLSRSSSDPRRRTPSAAENRSLEAAKPRRRVEIAVSEAYALSPKAPRCSSRWRELLGLKKLQNSKSEPQKQSPAPGKISNARSLKHLLHKNHRSSATDSSSLSLPLLRDSDSESVSISSSRLFLSSSSLLGTRSRGSPRSPSTPRSLATARSRSAPPSRAINASLSRTSFFFTSSRNHPRSPSTSSLRRAPAAAQQRPTASAPLQPRAVRPCSLLHAFQPPSAPCSLSSAPLRRCPPCSQASPPPRQPRALVRQQPKPRPSLPVRPARQVHQILAPPQAAALLPAPAPGHSADEARLLPLAVATGRR
ncbi:hypothetical protein J5N97_017745 [Dioscorea zingiberensis]|uniref:Uncharacterized protein n=1 Tax=Dioscorea zingiberensis TaxID=325984 RepID=A0A9D5HGN4_9LILI|nr:hypothetical protein J5N97_017745 [Dioscorea zingiberensis]